MTRLQRAALTVAALVLAACVGDPEPPTWAYDRGAGNLPNAEIRPSNLGDGAAKQLWRIQANEFGRPFHIRLLNDSLAVVLDRALPFMHLLDFKRSRYLYALTVAGDDADGVMRAHRIALSPSDANEFVAYDLVGNTLTTFRIGGDKGQASPVQTINLSAIETVDAPVMFAGGSVTVEPVRENSLRALALPNGELSAHSGLALSSLSTDRVPPAVWRKAMEGQTCASPDRKKLARTFSYMGQVLVLDSAGNRIDGIGSARAFDPQFEVKNQTGEVVFAPTGNSARVAYRACGVTEDFVFTLFSGRRPRQTERAPEAGATQIHVFDWRANMVGAFRLQRDVVSMDVTADGRTLVALEGGFSFAVVGYAIPRGYRTR